MQYGFFLALDPGQSFALLLDCISLLGWFGAISSQSVGTGNLGETSIDVTVRTEQTLRTRSENT